MFYITKFKLESIKISIDERVLNQNFSCNCGPHKSIQILRILCRQSNQEIPDPQPPLGKIWDVMSQKRHHRNEMWHLYDVVCIKCKETFLRKDTFQIWYRCRGGGGGARSGILISPDTMEHFLLWRGNCRGQKVATVHNVHFVKYDGPVVKSWNPKMHFLMGKKYFWGYFSYVVLGRKL